MTTFTKEQLTRIIECADEVLSALAGTNDDVHKDDSTKMCRLWDDLNDMHAPPAVVKELARIALAGMEQDPFMYGVSDPAGEPYISDDCVCDDIGSLESTVAELNNECGEEFYRVVPLYTAPQPTPVTQAAWVAVPVEPTPEMREAFHVANQEAESGHHDVWSPDHQWNAMLAAIPQQEKQ